MSDDVKRAMAELWRASRPVALGRVAAIAAAAAAAQAGRLAEAQRANAEGEAHKLAGIAGTFGFADVSAVAREAEEILEGAAPIGEAAAARLSDIARRLERGLAPTIHAGD